jgi:hypothetical protein
LNLDFVQDQMPHFEILALHHFHYRAQIPRIGSNHRPEQGGVF